MFSNFVTRAVNELIAIPSIYFVVLQRLSIVILLIVLLVKIIIPYFKYICISRNVAFNRAKIDVRLKLANEEQAPPSSTVKFVSR